MKELIFMKQNDLPKNARHVDSASEIQNQVDLDCEKKNKNQMQILLFHQFVCYKKCLVNTH